MKKILTLALVLLLAGCTSAGPFVTSVSLDRSGALTVEKCKAEFNPFLGAVSMGQCISSTSR